MSDDLEAYVRFLSSYFYVDGLERDDLEQEARLAAFLAPDGYGRIAARRRVLDLLKASQREKRGRMVWLDESVSSALDVLEAVIVRDTLRTILETPMTDVEAEALGRVLRGEPIGRADGRLDSARYRLRRRLKRPE